MSAPELTRWQELACDAVLVGLDEAERAELDALDVEAELFALELAAGEVAATTLAAGELAMALPGAVAERVLARVEPRPHAAPRGGEVVPLASRSPRPWLPWAVAAAAVVLAFVGWSRRGEEGRADGPVTSRQQLLASGETARLPWSATKDEAARGAGGEVAWNAALQRGYMTFRGLAPNDPKRSQYQLWIFDAERDEAFPVDGGVFDVAAGGEVVVPIEAKLRVGKAKLFAITVEKPGGVVVSKRERIVLTASPPG